MNCDNRGQKAAWVKRILTELICCHTVSWRGRMSLNTFLTVHITLKLWLGVAVTTVHRECFNCSVSHSPLHCVPAQMLNDFSWFTCSPCLMEVQEPLVSVTFTAQGLSRLSYTFCFARLTRHPQFHLYYISGSYLYTFRDATVPKISTSGGSVVPLSWRGLYFTPAVLRHLAHYSLLNRDYTETDDLLTQTQ